MIESKFSELPNKVPDNSGTYSTGQDDVVAVVLASSSKARWKLLVDCGISPHQFSPAVDEASFLKRLKQRWNAAGNLPVCASADTKTSAMENQTSTVSKVYVDPKLSKACGLPDAKDQVEALAFYKGYTATSFLLHLLNLSVNIDYKTKSNTRNDPGSLRQYFSQVNQQKYYLDLIEELDYPCSPKSSGDSQRSSNQVTSISSSIDLEQRQALASHKQIVIIACDSMLEHQGKIYGKPSSIDEARARLEALSGSTATLWTGHYLALLERNLVPKSNKPNSDTDSNSTPGNAKQTVATGNNPHSDTSEQVEDTSQTPTTPDLALASKTKSSTLGKATESNFIREPKLQPQVNQTEPLSLWRISTHCLEARSTSIRFSTLSEPEIQWYLSTAEPMQVAGSFTLEGYGQPFIEGINGDPSNVIGLSIPLLRKLLHSMDICWDKIIPNL